jgi:aspartyl-tRNA(Asn)/glutamyl-tRNA(Gln) amidotransferase subunit C
VKARPQQPRPPKREALAPGRLQVGRRQLKRRKPDLRRALRLVRNPQPEKRARKLHRQPTTPRASGAQGAPLRIHAVIDRDEVLHVARLARLILTEDEIVAMQRDLGSVLDHIEKIGELDLTAAQPMSYVIPLAGTLRDDEPAPCLPREKALESAPAVSDHGFLVPSPQA